MADYTDSKPGYTITPINAVATVWDRTGPLVSPKQIREEFLFGIPLVSKMVDPITNKPMVMTDTIIEGHIRRAVSVAEESLKIDIFPVQRYEKHDFDRNRYDAFLWTQVEHRPVSSIEAWQVEASDHTVLYTIPQDWIEVGGMIRGRLQCVPLTAAFLGTGGTTVTGGTFSSAGGIFYLSILGLRGNVPMFWKLTYTSGFPEGLIPVEVNEYIATIACMEILGQLAATYATSTSHSLGYDGISQSVSTPGPQLFKIRMDELAEKRKELKNTLKSKFYTKFIMGNI